MALVLFTKEAHRQYDCTVCNINVSMSSCVSMPASRRSISKLWKEKYFEMELVEKSSSLAEKVYYQISSFGKGELVLKYHSHTIYNLGHQTNINCSFFPTKQNLKYNAW